MKARSSLAARRQFLMTSLLAGLGGLGIRRARAAAQDQKATLIAKLVERIPDDPADETWNRSDVLDVPMAPQAVVKPRIYEVATKMLAVRSLYDDERIAVLMEWQDAGRDAQIGKVSAFRDAVAIEFPAQPASGVPYFAMGEPDKPVTIYQWKADWGQPEADDVKDASPDMTVDWYPLSGRGPGENVTPKGYGEKGAEKAFHTSWWSGNALGDPSLQARTTVEKLRAEGFGTLTSVAQERQDGMGKGVWRDGVWRVLLSLPRAQETFSFSRGMTLPVAFAAWNGAAGERGGEKAVSTWYFLSLEKPVPALAFLAPVAALVGVAAAQGWGLRRLRRRADRNEEGKR